MNRIEPNEWQKTSLAAWRTKRKAYRDVLARETQESPASIRRVSDAYDRFFAAEQSCIEQGLHLLGFMPDED